MTTTLHDILAAGEPDLPPAPRRPGGRHRADRGSISPAVLVFLAGLMVLAVLGVADYATRADRERAGRDCSTSTVDSAPTPVPGAPPQAPHAGFPGSETLAPFIADTEETP